jgi:hypothetical protein
MWFASQTNVRASNLIKVCKYRIFTCCDKIWFNS